MQRRMGIRLDSGLLLHTTSRGGIPNQGVFRWKNLFSFGGCVFLPVFFLALWVHFLVVTPLLFLVLEKVAGVLSGKKLEGA